MTAAAEVGDSRTLRRTDIRIGLVVGIHGPGDVVAELGIGIAAMTIVTGKANLRMHVDVEMLDLGPPGLIEHVATVAVDARRLGARHARRAEDHESDSNQARSHRSSVLRPPRVMKARTSSRMALRKTA